MERWNPPVELSKKEQLIMKRLNRGRALFGFLRTKRHILFDDAFQEQLEGMYRQTGAGDPPHPPAWLCMVLLLQGYVGASDAEAVEMAVMDRRWQLVLDCLDVEDAPFAQGALQAFRERMIELKAERNQAPEGAPNPASTPRRTAVDCILRTAAEGRPARVGFGVVAVRYRVQALDKPERELRALGPRIERRGAPSRA